MELAEAKLQPAYRAYRAPVTLRSYCAHQAFHPLIGLTIHIVTGLIDSEQNQIVFILHFIELLG